MTLWQASLPRREAARLMWNSMSGKLAPLCLLILFVSQYHGYNMFGVYAAIAPVIIAASLSGLAALTGKGPTV
jgi:hypothetical protein